MANVMVRVESEGSSFGPHFVICSRVVRVGMLDSLDLFQRVLSQTGIDVGFRALTVVRCILH